MASSIEGRDYFYDRALGVNVTCPEKCDLPTGYSLLCAEKCPGYTPKLRSTTPHAQDNESDPFDSLDTKWLILIVTVSFIIALLILIFLFIFRKQVLILVRRLNEIFCERLVRAVPEVGTGSYQPVTQGGDLLFSIRESSTPEATADLNDQP